MPKRKPPEGPVILYSDAENPPLEFADFVRLSSGPSGVVFGFGQNHPYREEVTLIYEVLMPYEVAVRLHEILGGQLKTQLKAMKKLMDEK